MKFYRKVLNFLKWKKAEFLNLPNTVRNLKLKKQEELIQEKDWRNLIILDACRYDFFKEEIKDYFSNNETSLFKVLSPASHTTDWLKRVFPKRYNFIYFSSNPFINSKNGPSAYHAPNHFSEIIDVWDHGWDKKLGTVYPKEINKHVLNYEGREKFIIHYMQPHGPFIGEEKITSKSSISKNEVLRDREISQMVKKGKIERKTYIKAYKENLKLVLEYASKLTHKLNDKTVITADHGELLGEYGLFLHPNCNVPELRVVPWMEINSD